MTKPNGPKEETCGRCGYPKSDHKEVGPEVLICPSSLYLKDQLQEIVNQP